MELLARRRGGTARVLACCAPPAAWPGDLSVQVSRADREESEAQLVKLDASKARARLGWTPRWSLERAVDRIVDWYGAYGRDEDLRAVTLEQIGAFEREAEPAQAATSSCSSSQVSPRKWRYCSARSLSASRPDGSSTSL